MKGIEFDLGRYQWFRDVRVGRGCLKLSCQGLEEIRSLSSSGLVFGRLLVKQKGSLHNFLKRLKMSYNGCISGLHQDH